MVTRGRSFVVRLCSLVLFSALVASASAQTRTKVQFGAPSGEQFRYAIDHLTDLSPEERQALVAKIRNVFPVFVFIPGIMGSKLSKKLPDGTKIDLFGNLSSLHPDNPNLAFDKPSTEVSAELMEEYVIDFYVWKRHTPIYQNAKKMIEEMSTKYGVDVMFFGYDWRQSNMDSAKDLSKWLCRWRSNLEGRPVVFIAHSMGGLVLKYWLSTEYDKLGCKNNGDIFSNWLKIERVSFLGTPHYGAPQAFFAFAESYYYLYAPLAAKATTNWFSKRVNLLYSGLDSYFLSPVNSYGATFESGYQLLPITMTSCFVSQIPPPILIKLDGKEESFDIFKRDNWESYGWPRNLAASIVRSDFVSHELPERLEKAKSFLCDVAKYDIDADRRFKVFRYYGNHTATICSITVRESGRKNQKWEVDPQACGAESDDSPIKKGDGTVPAWVASEARRGDVLDNNTIALASDHVYLAEDARFIADLKSYFDDFHRRLQEEFAAAPVETIPQERAVPVVDATPTPRPAGSAQPSPTLVNLYSGMKRLIPSEYDLPSSGVTAQTNREIVRQLKLEPRDVYRVARRGTKDPTKRALGFRVYNDVAANEGKLIDQVGGANRRNAWALNNAAHIYLQRRDFGRSLEFARRAIVAADGLKTRERRQIKAKASLTAAVAARKLKDVTEEKRQLAMAVENRNRKASRYQARWRRN